MNRGRPKDWDTCKRKSLRPQQSPPRRAHPSRRKTGVDPRQYEAEPSETRSLVAVASAGSYAEYPLTDAVGELGDTGVRGRSAMAFLYAIARRLEEDLAEARKELAQLRAQASSLKDKLANSEQRSAVFA